MTQLVTPFILWYLDVQVQSVHKLENAHDLMHLQYLDVHLDVRVQPITLSNKTMLMRSEINHSDLFYEQETVLMKQLFEYMQIN